MPAAFDPAAAFDDFERAWRDGDGDAAGTHLGRVLGAAGTSPSALAAAYAESIRRIDHDEPRLAARYALCAGALVENDADPAPLARALRGPLLRTLKHAALLVDAAHALPALGRGDDDDGDADDAWIAGRSVDRAALEALRAKHAVSAAALDSLEVWYRPVVAAWTRAHAVLCDAQRDEELRRAVRRVDDALPWVRILLGAVSDAPFVVLVPELHAGYALVIDGVTDVGQLSILLAAALPGVVDALGAGPLPGDDVLAVARGDGPQEIDDGFSCSLHLYPWQALDPSTGMPQDGRFTWLAPGGSGTHSLPPDFQPGDIVPVDGSRVLLLAGPSTPGGMRFIREIPATRLFHALHARVDGVRALDAAEVAAWTAAITRERA